MNRLRLYGFSENDRKVFSSYLSIIESKTLHEWQIVSDWDIDLIFVDEVCDREGLIEKKLKAKGFSVVMYGDAEEIAGKHNVISRPLRAGNILKVLDSFDGVDGKKPTKITRSDGGQETLYRLKRWPSKHILAEAPKASRLSAAFMQGSKTISQAALQVGLAESEVVTFVRLCCNANCMSESKIDVGLMKNEEVTSPEVKNKNFQLFEKIRRKFTARSKHG